MRDDATQRQVDAALPDASTWLAANAGSGKTRVLTDRVARLLLDEVAPENVLCLTYTKAAASEMQNRLFKRLGAWAMLDDEGLRAELAALGADRDLDRVFLQRARTLFARAIETPGGLRIQTIHSFCAGLLRRFPLEAGVSPGFREVEDRAAELLRAEILDAMAAGSEAGLVAEVARHFTGADDDFDGLLQEILRAKAAFLPPRDAASLRAAYDLPAGFDTGALLAGVFLGGEAELLAELVPLMRASDKSTDRKCAETLAGWGGPTLAGLECLEGVLLTGSGANAPFSAKTGVVPTKGLRNDARVAALAGRLDDLMRRVEAARPLRCALAALERDLALHRFAQVFLPAYAEAKTLRGWLDFDDLIEKAHALLSDGRVADWVLYRLDGGIDHILVDEAQDTAPLQWQVIEKLAREFTAGAGARDGVVRTIFVVGDKKQSIYSFQGADPGEFDRMRAEFAARLESTGRRLQALSLAHSFRSAAPVLAAVDATFEGAEASGFSPEERHIAFHSEKPGRVDLWPAVTPAEKEEEGAWFDPVDRPAKTHHDVVLARRIAGFIAGALADGQTLPVPDGHGGWAARPLRAGDVLILVRRRAGLFREIIRACKAEGLPIAGADRLKVMAELAVRDVGALLAFLATQEDDLSLAAALRSPLFGLSERALYGLAQGRRRGMPLWEALRARRAEFPQVLEMLDDLRGQTDFLRPYDLIERILTRHEGRARLIARLGAEAEDGLDALLAQALAYEENAVPSLTGFLGWMQTDDLEIKRSPEAAGDRIRVMTVHGAKGLEAPLVILPDCAQWRNDVRDRVLASERAGHWKAPSGARPALQDAAEEALRTRQAQERDRLLYVAMTRAESWLVVAAAGNLGRDGQAWHDRVRDGLVRAGARERDFDWGALGAGAGLTLGDDWSGLPVQAAPAAAAPAPELPATTRLSPPPAAPRPPLRSPSDLGGAKALPGEAGEESAAAQARGTALHALLETLPGLPEDDRPGFGARLLDGLGVAPERRAELMAEAAAVLAVPDFALLFAPEALAEVPLAGTLPGLGPVSGVIDRLVLGPETVLAVDFKSNRTLPAVADQVPKGLLRQMGAYAALLAAIYPGRRVATALLWTAGPRLMELPHETVMAALDRARRLDGAGGAP
ncbi:double-strand break repair helicase AddA [Roseivivax sp. CAU 1761]